MGTHCRDVRLISPRGMRSAPTILTFVLTAAMWMVVPWAMRQRRARMAAVPSPREMRSYHLHNAAVISTTVGITGLSAWLMTDGAGPQWLHALSAPAALIFIAVGAALAGYASWLGGP